MRKIGIVLAALGVLMAGYALLIFDPSVAVTGGMRVNNIGLMQDRQNLLIAGGFAAVMGVLLLILGSKKGPTHDTQDVPTTTVEDLLKSAVKADNVQSLVNLMTTERLSPNGELALGRGYLQYAVSLKSKGTVALLLRMGANPERKDSTGSSALEKCTDSEIRHLLIRDRSISQVYPGSSKHETPTADYATQLQKLAELRDAGVLAQDEFDAAKSRLVSAA